MPEKLSYNNDFNDCMRPRFDEEFDSAVKNFELNQTFSPPDKAAIQKYVEPLIANPKNIELTSSK